MNTRQRVDQKEQLAEILEFLNEKRIRGTYGAVGYVVGFNPILVNKDLLGDNRPEASWIVNSRRRKPTGYTEDQYHPELFRTEKIIYSGPGLMNALDEWRLRRS